MSEAANLVQQHPLKAYDSVHLALALDAQVHLTGNEIELIFVSGDGRLLEAAQSEGLATTNPFDYIHLDNP